MKRTNFCVLASALAVVGGAGVAQAQQTSNVGVSLRLGVFLPTDSDTSSTFGSTWFGFGAEYQFLHLGKTGAFNTALSLSTDYFSRNDITETPILVNYVAQSSTLFWSAGLGASFDHVPGDSQTKFGYQIGVGYNLPVSELPLFVEAKFWGTDTTAYDGVGLYVGVRF